MKRGLVLLLAGVLAGLVPAAAMAGGWGLIKLAEPLGQVEAGEVTVRLQVLQHGRTPFMEGKLVLTATGPKGQTAQAEALPDAAAKEYVGTIRFSDPGDWTLTAAVADTWLHVGVQDFPVAVVGTEAAGAGEAPVRPATDWSNWYVTGPAMLLVGVAGVFFLRRRAPAVR